MKNLIDFFDRNRYVLFFLLLQIICFILIAQNNSFQGRAMFNASNSVTGYVYQKKTSVNDYFKLKTINENLSDENALLRTLLHAYNKDNFKKAFEVNDSVYQINYEFSPAKIIDYTFNKTKNYITIDIGSNQGISEDMGLISDKGVIGRIKEVSPNYAVAYSIMHEDFVLSVKHKENGQFGLLQNSNKGINIWKQ